MRQDFLIFYKFSLLALLAYVSFSSVSYAQDEGFARKRCVEVGFPAGTVGHADCVKQYLKSAGKSKSAAPKLEAKPSEEIRRLEEDKRQRVGRSNLPPCQGSDASKWSKCFGSWTATNGSKYVGEWKDGSQHGYVTATYPNGDKLVGEFKDGKINGQGTYTWANGDKYVGEFKNDKSHGQGTYTYASGMKQIGEFSENKLNGRAVIYSEYGLFLESGIYKDDVLIESQYIDPNSFSRIAKSPVRYEKNYFQVEKELMTNITGSKKVMVVQIAVMTHYDSRVFDNIIKHEFALRSAMLDLMRQTTEAEVSKIEFRKELAVKLKDIMNSLLEDYEDFGGVEEVMFTSFVVH